MSPILGKVLKNNTLRLDQENDIKQHDNYNPEFACTFQNYSGRAIRKHSITNQSVFQDERRVDK